MSRTSLLKLGAFAALAFGAGPAARAASGVLAPAANDEGSITPAGPAPRYLRLATYVPLVGSTFRINRDGASPLKVKLVSAKRAGGQGRVVLAHLPRSAPRGDRGADLDARAPVARPFRPLRRAGRPRRQGSGFRGCRQPDRARGRKPWLTRSSERSGWSASTSRRRVGCSATASFSRSASTPRCSRCSARRTAGTARPTSRCLTCAVASPSTLGQGPGLSTYVQGEVAGNEAVTLTDEPDAGAHALGH